MKSLFRLIQVLAMAGAIQLLATGCETAKGLGRDMEDAGEELQKAAD
jgi:predicted small secreted protein